MMSWQLWRAISCNEVGITGTVKVASIDLEQNCDKGHHQPDVVSIALAETASSPEDTLCQRAKRRNQNLTLL